MSRIFLAGNEFNDYTADGFTNFNVAPSSTFNQPGGARSPMNNGGNYYFYCQNGWGLRKDFSTQFPFGLREVYGRFHFHPGGRTDGTWEIARFLDSAQAVMHKISLVDNGSGGSPSGSFRLQVHRGDNVLILDTNYGFRNDAWYTVEFHYKPKGSGGIVELWCNGIFLGSVTGSILGPSAQNAFFHFVIFNGNISGGGVNYRAYDDIALNGILSLDVGGNEVDISGTIHNNRCGEGYVLPLLPARNGGTANQLTNAFGTTTDNFNHVNKLVATNPNGFVGTNTAGQQDRYAAPTLPEEFRGVQAMKAVAYASRNGPGISKAKMLIKPPAQTEISLPAGVGVGLALPVGGFGWIEQIFETNPNTSAPFTPDEVNAMEEGIQLIA